MTPLSTLPPDPWQNFKRYLTWIVSASVERDPRARRELAEEVALAAWAVVDEMDHREEAG